jgi:hypothetical protein
MAESFDGSGTEWRADQERSASLAWVWSQYKGEFPQTTSERELASWTAAARTMRQGGTTMILSNRTKRGIILAVAVLAGLTSFWLGALVLVLAAVLIAWGQEPKRTEEFVEGLPFGNYLLKALAQLDLLLSSRNLEQ